MSSSQYNLVVLISGNGSNLQALIDACASSALPNTRITRVISKYVGGWNDLARSKTDTRTAANSRMAWNAPQKHQYPQPTTTSLHTRRSIRRTNKAPRQPVPSTTLTWPKSYWLLILAQMSSCVQDGCTFSRPISSTRSPARASRSSIYIQRYRASLQAQVLSNGLGKQVQREK